MRILITGAQGQLGQSFAWLKQQGQAGRAELILLGRAQLDICQTERIGQALDHYQPDAVINAAAYTAVDKAESEPQAAYLLNATAVGWLAQACAQRGLRFLQVSTDYVFDGQQKQPYRETDPTAPVSVYGKSKLAGEQAAVQALPSSLILRTSWVFSQFGHNFLTTMFRLGAERPALGIVADQWGGPTYAPHIAQVLLDLAQQESAQGVYHFAGEPVVSWYQFAQHIFEQAVNQQKLAKAPALKPISTASYPTPAPRPAQSALQQNKLDTVLAKPIDRDWQAGLRLSLENLC